MTVSEPSARPTGLHSLPRLDRIISFIGILTAIFLSSLDQTVVGTAMPRIIADLGGFGYYTWVATAYIIASAVAIPVTGRLTDIYGRKVFFVFGLGAFLLFSMACGLSRTMPQLIISRGLQGLGGGVMMANAFSGIGDLFPPKERGKYIGFVSAIFGLSAIAGPFLGGIITDTLSWHWVFFLNLPLGIVALVLFVRFFPNLRPEVRKHTADYAGIVAVTLAIVAGMLALSWGGVQYPWGSIRIIGLIGTAAVSLAAFIWVEKRAAEPIIPLTLFKDRVVTLSCLVTLLIGFAMFGTIIFIPLFFQGVLGMSATASGSFLTPMSLGMVLGAFLSGQMLSRMGGHYKLQGIAGIGIMAIGLGLMTTMSLETGPVQALVNTVTTGFGLGLTFPLYTISVQNAVPYNLLGVGTSITIFSRSLGGSIGLAVLGTVMHSRVAADLRNAVSTPLQEMIRSPKIAAIAQNPQLLLDPGLQQQLKGLMDPMDAGGYAQFMLGMRHALSHALSHAFGVALLVAALAFVVNLFLKEVPLKRAH